MSSSLATNEIEDVPDISIDWYRAVTGLAHDAPGWVQALADVATEAVILVFGALVLANLWRTRRADRRLRVLAFAAPAVTVLAYAISEVTKTFVEQERPCREVRNIVATIAECPEPGDWSFPSNHSTIAAAAAVGLAVAWRRLAIIVALLAVLEAFLRVFVGVHYPHDVIAGLLLGSIVAAAGMALTTALTKTIRRPAAQRR
ncbi:phosphatase PAP2 family protein [Saccharopolyspora elongata]|uniref:Phosphatase PAP2 family protein n=1 Tax=Saccharopolyspora elongata TaxID=2530387 RepID=A0A4R4YH04_9PSEU|nr:phosphatase PAP2 family protein [Saccharopolyspora elongata]TDD43199.1 phosphatase PAP2 family protein [Saccharopolyspora elongata]